MKGKNSQRTSDSKTIKGSKKDYAKKLFEVLSNEPISRRMAATKIGFIDQTFMVTQLIYDWIKNGKAQVVCSVKCSRSGRFVEGITTDQEKFISPITNQLNIFDNE